MRRAVDVPLAHRAEHWRRLLTTAIAPMDVRLREGPGTLDSVAAAPLGRVQVARVSIGPGGVHRTRRHIGRRDPAAYHVVLHVAGDADLQHQGRGGRLTPGTLSVVDLAEPFACRHSAETIVALTVPKSLMPLSEADVNGVTGVPLSGSEGAARLLAGMLRELSGRLDEVDPQSSARLGVALVDLVAATITPLLRHRPGESANTMASRRRALLLQIHRYIEERLAHPDLGPEQIAAAHHISLRYLHKLFESQATSVAGLIRQRRLEGCRRDLLDPNQGHRTVSAVGASHGFVSDTQFSRAFRSRYGVPPGEFRRAHLQADPG
jgi:AraC-like DNA-binding protein